MNLLVSKILEANSLCFTQKRVEQILLHDTNSILQIPNKVENSKLIGSKLELNKVDKSKFAFSYKKEESSLYTTP